ncbi:MAG: hypothetical protein IPP29_06410 [Bacteroidetes bacterium]|nr:hypothetical protein [Bacteroidota bacterium]
MGFAWQCLPNFGSTKEEIGIGISSTKDGNYLLACTQYDPNTFIENPWIIKVDTGGTYMATSSNNNVPCKEPAKEYSSRRQPYT